MDLNLPKSTLVNKFVAKTKFYQKTNISTKLQSEFVNKIQRITWKYKLAEETIGISKTDNVVEIQVFDIELKKQVIPKNIIRIIDKTIPYPILYRFIYQDNWAFGIAYKEHQTLKYFYYSDWNEELNFDFSGINLEIVYQKLIKAFINDKLKQKRRFEEIISIDQEIKNLDKEITTLENKIRKEKQFNRKVDLNKILLERRKRYEELKSK